VSGLVEQKGELKRISERIDAIANQLSESSSSHANQLSALSAQVQELKEDYTKRDKNNSVVNWKLFWLGAILGLIGGALGGLVDSYLIEVYHFQFTMVWQWEICAIVASALFFLIIFSMWKLVNKPPKNL
jgi:Mg/Co/Ni transporter MgtE